jgi:tetratricopeptide (TPR) repeat protein
MGYEIACGCGKLIPVTEEMAGSHADCECGGTVLVPSRFEMRAADVAGVSAAVIPDAPLLEKSPPVRKKVVEIIAPMPATLLAELGPQSGPRVPVMVALTAYAIWIQETWRLRSVSLDGLRVEPQEKGKEIELALGPHDSNDRLTLRFGSASQRNRWHEKIQAAQSKFACHRTADGWPVPEGVALVKHAPDLPHSELGRVAFLHHSPDTSDQGIQLRAAMLGANSIIDYNRKKCRQAGWGAREVSGMAVRITDADDLQRMRWKWYAEEVSELIGAMLLLILIQAALQFFVLALLPGKTSLLSGTGETLEQSIASAGLGLALWYAWPLVMMALLWVLHWRELLRPTGIAVLAVTTLQGLAVIAAHVLVVFTEGTAFAATMFWIAMDPVEWVFIFIGAVLCVNAWRLARKACEILPEEAQVVSTPRRLWSWGLLGSSAIFALLCLVGSGMARYYESAHLVREGVDPKREHEAMLAMNEGAARANKGDLLAAFESFQRSLDLWEELTAKASAPSIYRVNLAITLSDLGWVRRQQHRDKEAEDYYSRAVDLADHLAGDPQFDTDTQQRLAEARAWLASVRGDRSSKLLETKDDEAAAKYEEAQVASEKDSQSAERLIREAIATWEEVLPQAGNAEYTKFAVSRLNTAWLSLAGLQERLGKRGDAEVSLNKAIDYGRRAVELDPGRPLVKHNRDLAVSRLETLRSAAFDNEIDKLTRAGRLAAAIEHFKKGIKEQEERVQAGKDLEPAIPTLAHRLDRFAWMLAHCPDRTRRDPTAAIQHARRATSLRPDVADYWYTLAMVQYRNGNWQDSLASLEALKARQGGEFGASDWLVSAMNLYRLNREEEAQAAVAKAVEWMEERRRKAVGNALLRMEYELMRPAVEALLREAQNLISGEPDDSRRPA